MHRKGSRERIASYIYHQGVTSKQEISRELGISMPTVLQCVRTLVDECAAEATDYGNSQSDESIAADKQTCIDAGCEIITLDEATLAEMREKAAGVYDMVRADLGDELVDQLLAAVEAAK